MSGQLLLFVIVSGDVFTCRLNLLACGLLLFLLLLENAALNASFASAVPMEALFSECSSGLGSGATVALPLDVRRTRWCCCRLVFICRLFVRICAVCDDNRGLQIEEV